ncbi:P-loop NTPase [Microbacterium sp. SSW1-59]|uniref:AAA family ATPase n=1 Tax=Microbacterium xanthum TaxID=3079794 RepID=UPI002AD56CF4|nr:P-loop NTPase [Microbacterium sp. SSW1-59]MDZ8201621.1 P-loop NTPase [Microbacterium sp. SSW1-59]
MRALVAVDGARDAYADQLRDEGVDVVAVVSADTPALAAADAAFGHEGDTFFRALREVDVLLLRTRRSTLTEAVVALCDRGGVRIVALVGEEDDERIAESFGLLTTIPLSGGPPAVADLVPAYDASPASTPPRSRDAPHTIVVWGPHGAPGRSTIAIELAVELARGDRRVGLIDADSHAPSLAPALGLADEGPGFAAACRQAAHGTLDARELTRISLPLERTGVDVLPGINRPSRWPELAETRVEATLAACRAWVDHTVVDVAAPLEQDEEIMSDLDAPRRNGATLAALRTADLVVAVAAADPIGIARYLRGHTELRAIVGATPILTIANRLRPGALGIDARGQVRRTLDRFGGVVDVRFLPADGRSTDAALLAARPIALAAPRSPLVAGIRRFVGEAVLPPRTSVPETASRLRRSRRRLRSVGATS